MQDESGITGSPGAADAPLEPALELVGIFISAGHDYWGRQGEGRMQHGIDSVDEVACEAARGLVGDRYHRTDAPGRDGRGRRDQVTFFDEAVYRAVRERFRLKRLPPTVFRRNLLVRGHGADGADGADGAGLDALLGRRFVVQGVMFEGSQECRPCEWMDRTIAPGARAFLDDHFRGGLRARILSGGELRVETPKPS